VLLALNAIMGSDAVFQAVSVGVRTGYCAIHMLCFSLLCLLAVLVSCVPVSGQAAATSSSNPWQAEKPGIGPGMPEG